MRKVWKQKEEMHIPLWWSFYSAKLNQGKNLKEKRREKCEKEKQELQYSSHSLMVELQLAKSVHGKMWRRKKKKSEKKKRIIAIFITFPCGAVSIRRCGSLWLSLLSLNTNAINVMRCRVALRMHHNKQCSELHLIELHRTLRQTSFPSCLWTLML